MVQGQLLWKGFKVSEFYSLTTSFSFYISTSMTPSKHLRINWLGSGTWKVSIDELFMAALGP